MSRRKAEMVLKLIDKASRPARRFMATQKRMGRVTELANRVSERSAAAAKRATDLYTRSVGRLGRAQDALRARMRRTNQVIATQRARLRSSAAMMRDGALGMGRAALVAGGLWTAYSGTVSAAGAAMLSPARQFERFQTVLTTTEGSAQAAQEAMKWVEDFAVKTPYELDQVMASFVQLRAYGLDPTNGMLKTLGDASAAMNKPLMQSVEAMADAVTGENERLKELGIKAAKVGQHFEYSYTGQDGTTKIVRALANDRQAIQASILGIFNERYDGSMDRLSKTFDGMFSNVVDQWTKFQRMIMGFGVFDWMKSKLKLVLDEINRLEASGELELWAKRIADNILIGLEAIWSFGASAVEFWQTLYPILQAAADALGGWRNLALALLAIPLRGFLIGAAFGMFQFARGALLAGRSLASIGLLSAASEALRLGGAFLALLNPLKLVRAAFIAIRFAIISTGIGALVVGLAMAGVWIYNNWSGLVAFFKGFGGAFMASLGPARPLVQGIVDIAADLWQWMTDLTGPIDASAETWRQWGVTAGEAVGSLVSNIMNLPTYLSDLSGQLYDKGVEFMQSLWDGMASILTVMVDSISAKLAGIIPDWMKSAWEWAQGNDTEASTRAALLANRPGPQPGVAASGKAARAAAVAGALAAGGGGAFAAPGEADGSRYVNARVGNNTTVSAPVTIEIKGNVDREVMPDLEELAERTADKVEERIRDAKRWGHD
ncbi:tape measure protein [Ruegeria arenilitoris]|uniref:tape measure protein n=1 Tax=Ruegeria arenilitoris TaxID=1173585 RepID=UPI00147F1046|nr:tape measure protein [Ruegeria arenilitoris]